MNISIASILISSLIILFAFFVRSLAGFGSALISIPLLTLLFDLKFAVPLESLFEVGISLLLLKQVYKKINKKILIPLVIGAIVGTVIGSFFLKSFANILLKKLLGVVVILFALYMIRKKGKGVKLLSPKIGYIAGLIGGILGGMFGTSGPPFVMYLTHQLKKKDVLRATLIGLFAIDYTWRVGVFTASGLLTIEILKFALLLTPALLIGTFLGSKTHTNISEQRFRQTVVGILVVSGLLLLK